MYTKIFFTYLSIARFGFARGSVISGLDFGQGHGKGLDDLLGVGRDNRVPYLVARFSEPRDVQAVEAFRFGLGRGETDVQRIVFLSTFGANLKEYIGSSV